MIEITEQPGNNNNETFINLISSAQLTEFGIRQAWFAAGKDLKKTANTAVLAKPRGGRVYIIRTPSGRKRRHTASRPGESHANLSGALRRSINWKVSGMEMTFGYGIVQRTTSYAVFVEEGTKKMDPRPTLANSVNANQRNIEQHMANAVFQEFKQ